MTPKERAATMLQVLCMPSPFNDVVRARCPCSAPVTMCAMCAMRAMPTLLEERTTHTS